MSKIDSEPEPTEIYINTDGMRKLAKSVKEGQGTRVGSIAKMLIDCCERIDRLTAELKDTKEKIRANFLWPTEDGSVEAAGYEFANAKTEAYQKLWWSILLDTAKEQALKGE